MDIISLSMDEESRRKLEYIEENSAFDGRSELIRKAISELYEQTQRTQGLTGEINAAVFVTHPHSSEDKIAEISHGNDDIVLTQLHNKLDDHACLEVFLVEGDAEEVVNFHDELKGSSATQKVELVLNH